MKTRCCAYVDSTAKSSLRSLWLVLCIAVANAMADKAGASDAPPLLSTPAEVDAYLSHTSPGQSPLDLLSVPARSRFISELRAGHFIIPDELDAELTRDEMLRVLRLFGATEVPSSMSPRKVHLSLGASESPERTRDFDALNESRLSQGGREVALSLYNERFRPSQNADALRQMTDGDVALFVRAAMIASQFSPETSKDVLVALSEADRRGITAPAWVNRTHNSFVTRRDFVQANVFRTQHLDVHLPLMPTVLDERHGEGPSVLKFVDEGGHETLLRQTMNTDAPAQVFVVAGCHFSIDAAKAIESDPEMRSLFSRHVSWITPPEYNPADPELISWNHDHPIEAMTTVWKADEWPFDLGAMPTFYFLRRGRVEATVVGYQRNEIQAGFQKIGLLQSSKDH